MKATDKLKQEILAAVEAAGIQEEAQSRFEEAESRREVAKANCALAKRINQMVAVTPETGDSEAKVHTAPPDTPAVQGLEQILNPNHPWHSEPLANAVKAWIELYSSKEGNKRDNTFRLSGGNTKYINDWLMAKVDQNMGETTKEHYRFVINPSKQGGPGKLAEP